MAVGDEGHNICSVAGYAHCIRTVLHLVAFAFCWMAPPCSLWVFLSTGIHKRSWLNAPGDTSRSDIRQSHLIVSRVCLLARIMSCRLVQWVVGQPVTYLMFRYRTFMSLRLCQISFFGLKLKRKFLWLGHWGGPMTKNRSYFLCGEHS